MTSTGGELKEHLTVKVKDDKIGCDNLGADTVSRRKISTVNSAGIHENPKVANGLSNGTQSKRYSVTDPTALTQVFATTPVAVKQPISEKEYDPYDHRDVKHPTTYSETLIHMLKASLGTGILAMPHAFKDAGYVVATIGTVIIGLICTYTIHILINAEYELCKRRKQPSMTYPETAAAAVSEGPKSVRWMAPYTPVICNTFLLCYQIGSCCIYVVFVSSNIKDVLDQYIQPLDVRVYMAILLLPLILINWVRNLKYLAPLSTIANAVTVVGFAIIFYYMFDDLPNIHERDAVGSPKGMPLYFGTVLFAMEAIGVVMPLENEMKKPKNFGSTFGVLNMAMLPITLLYTFVGFFGYLKFGNNVHGSITLDLPPKDWLAQAARLMLAFAIFITHALACYVAVDISWREYVEPRVQSRKLLWEYIVRTILVIITFLLAVAIPNLELFISLIGALCLSSMGLSFPALIQLFTYWDEYTGTKFFLFYMKNFLLIIIALLGFVVGTTTSVSEIIHHFFL